MVATPTSRRLVLADTETGEEEEVAANWLYVFIGAQPRTDWLGDAVRATGAASSSPGPMSRPATVRDSVGRCGAPPLLLETSRPGVFAAGDVRLASMKRVASAVGEGSSAVSNVHLYLETV